MPMQLQKQTHGRAQYIFGRLAFSDLTAVACGQQYWQRAVAGIIARKVAHAVAGRVARTQPWAGRLTGLSAGARRRSTASVAPWGAPSAVARWGSLLLLRRTAQSALGRFLPLGPPGGGPSPLSGPGGLRACLAGARATLAKTLNPAWPAGRS